MPRGDKTGPIGAGAMTGRGLGPCGGSLTLAKCAGLGVGLGGLGLGLACRNSFGGRGRRGSMQGEGRGMGRRMGVNQDYSRASKEVLTKQKELLEERLNLINEELDAL